MADLTPEALAAEMYQAAWQVCRAAGLFVIRWEDLTDPEQPRPAEAVAVTNGWLAAARTAMDRLAPAHAALAAERDALHESFGEVLRITWHYAGESDRLRIQAIAAKALEGGHG